MKRPLWLVLLLCAPALADDPPKPVVPVAVASVPTVQPLVVIADGSVSKSPLSWQVIAPDGTNLRTEGPIGLILNPVPGVTYKLALVAMGDIPPYAFRFVEVAAPALPKPDPAPVAGPPAPPVPTPTPANPPVPAPADQFGLVASTRAVLATVSWTADSLAWRQGPFARIFDDVAATAPTAGSAYAMKGVLDQAIAKATGKGPGEPGSMRLLVVAPIEARIGQLGVANKFGTPALFGQACADVAAALKGN